MAALRIAIPTLDDCQPDSPHVLELVEGQCARQASAFTPPVYDGTETLHGRTYWRYLTDAVPRA